MTSTTRTIGPDVQTLADREAIKEVRHRFALALDTRDWTVFDSLFTDAVDVDLPAFGAAHRSMPKAELVDLFRHTFRRPAAENPTQQLYGNFLIDIAGDAATCRSYLVGHHVLPGFSGGEEVTLRAQYLDHLTRTTDGWKIDATAIHVFAISGNPQIFA